MATALRPATLAEKMRNWFFTSAPVEAFNAWLAPAEALATKTNNAVMEAAPKIVNGLGDGLKWGLIAIGVVVGLWLVLQLRKLS